MKNEEIKRPVAVITGASMGIGEGLAERFGARFYDVALVARSGEALERIATRLRARYGVRAEVIAADLSEPGAAAQVVATVTERLGGVDLLVNNAGFGAHVDFATSDLASIQRMINVNVSALVELTHLCLPSIIERRGGVINIASNAAFQAVPGMAVYGATKAFVLSFSEALHMELKDRGLRVLAVCPGATKTNFFKTAGEGAQVGRARSVDDVVKTTIDAYDGGEMTVVDGLLNRIGAATPRLFPREVVAKVTHALMKRNPSS